MRSKLCHVAAAGVSIAVGLPSTAMWAGCGGSSTGAPPDGGVTAEAGGTVNSEGGAAPADGGGTDSSTGTGPDAAITGPYIDLSFGTCPPFTPCGGDPKGLFKITGGCVDETVFAGVKMQCAGLTVTNPKFQARGTVVADATTIARKTDVKFTSTFGVPRACRQALGASATCADVASAIMIGGGFDMATCTGTMDCTCDVGTTTLDSTSDPYTTSGNVLTTGAGTSARTYDYCVLGSEVKYKETTAKTMLPALFTLAK